MNKTMVNLKCLQKHVDDKMEVIIGLILALYANAKISVVYLNSLLLIDKQSNNSNVKTLRYLGKAILDFAGTGLVIFYDCWFLNRIFTHTITCKDNFNDEYEEDMKIRRICKEYVPLELSIRL